jgi:hypothetical protein
MYPFTAAVCHDGRCAMLLNPPPLVMPAELDEVGISLTHVPPADVERPGGHVILHAVGAARVSCVAPTAVTCGLAAGQNTWRVQSNGIDHALDVVLSENAVGSANAPPSPDPAIIVTYHGKGDSA